MRRHGRVLGAAAVAILVGLQQPGAGADERRDQRQEPPPELTVTAQSTLVSAGGTFTAAVLADGVTGTSDLRITVHDRVRTRSELARSRAGTGLRTVVGSTTAPMAGLAVAADGSRLLDFPLVAEGRSISIPGVYPVELEALDAEGDVLDEVITDLVVRPAASPATPPLAVAVVGQVGDDLTRAPDAAEISALAGALQAAPDVPATLAVVPAALDDLLDSTEPDDLAALEALRAAVGDHPLLALPYVPVSADALARAGIADELPRQIDRGDDVLRTGLGTSGSQHTWFAASDLGADGLQLLSALDVRHVVVPADGVEGAADGGLTLARPFVLAPPRVEGRRVAGPEEPVQALVADDRLAEALHAEGAPALIGAHAVAELAMVWFEQPGVRRAVVAPIDASVDPATVEAVLAALRTPELFQPVTLDAAFTTADPLEDGRGTPVRRSLTPDDRGGLPRSVADGVQALRSQRASVQGMVGPEAPEVAAIDRHLLRATAVGLGDQRRREELGLARAAIEDLDELVSTPETVTITLTSRKGTVPLTIRNDTGHALDVQLRFRSPKLELPGGDTRAVTLVEQTTRLDIEVRSRTSGAFPFEVEVTSPDGHLALATTRYSVRSTAVSGVGLGLSIGAGVFLVVWWARHWRASRNAKLVGEVGGPADSG